jgi:hypothetical protein
MRKFAFEAQDQSTLKSLDNLLFQKLPKIQKKQQKVALALAPFLKPKPNSSNLKE